LISQSYHLSFPGGVGGNGGEGGRQGGDGGTGKGPRMFYDVKTENFTVNLYAGSSSPKYYFSVTENLTEATPERF
jgi:hypothetical protein